MKKSRKYWADRFTRLEAAQSKKGADYFRELGRQYDKASRAIQTEIEAWYGRFAKENGLSMTDARRILNKEELKEFHWSVEEYIEKARQSAVDGSWIKELENASARVHVSRLEALKMQMQQHVELLYANEHDGVYELMKRIYTDGYYHTAYEIQKGFGIGYDLMRLDTGKVEKILAKPWAADGSNFSDRIWTSKTKLVNELYENLSQAVIRGKNPNQITDIIAQRMNVSKGQAGRLVMTESAFFNSAAERDCYIEMGCEEFEVLATLDSHTSDICQDMDGKHFPISQYQVGVTAPPFHVWCRSTTVPYFDDEFTLEETRAYREADGSYGTVPATMKYPEWKTKYVKDSITEQTKKQFAKYSEILGNNSPTVERFVEIKYNETEWKMFKSYTASIKSGELTPLADFDLYMTISKEMDEKLVGITTSNNITITGKSNHSIARVIGSVEQRRNGVSVSDVLDALTNSKSEILPVIETNNKKSQKFRNEVVEVSVNPDTGVIIQVNPVHTRKKVKP